MSFVLPLFTKAVLNRSLTRAKNTQQAVYIHKTNSKETNTKTSKWRTLWGCTGVAQKKEMFFFRCPVCQ